MAQVDSRFSAITVFWDGDQLDEQLCNSLLMQMLEEAFPQNTDDSDTKQ